jgi:hypothetical protein
MPHLFIKRTISSDRTHHEFKQLLSAPSTVSQSRSWSYWKVGKCRQNKLSVRDSTERSIVMNPPISYFAGAIVHDEPSPLALHSSRSCDFRLQLLTPTVFPRSSTESISLVAGLPARVPLLHSTYLSQSSQPPCFNHYIIYKVHGYTFISTYHFP